ncbi:iron-sulfur cluster assembly protein [Pengzhenrongella sicca]|uniref:Iron-sulfur cluster assembly protein n=1 Tax=Pengzhenrongella sicca TaxID=2819238 RepID=A0A8A4ZBN0_9MICO|nr:iron-sulfur cluster assembly protein [Pengzhenrongella sicca]QTE29400.1 iron-sulfur cluster assembly protein [Pengzhenrongella sicca]
MTIAVVTWKEVDAALSTVIDPELDEPITDLGFVTERVVTGGDVLVRLRLPTAFCSPSFAYLMASDAEDAIARLPGVASVRVLLDDHHDSDRINAGVAARNGFVAAYPREAAGELDELRKVFQVKAHAAYIERACTVMLREYGWEVADLGRLTFGDLPTEGVREGLGRRRSALGLDTSTDSLVMVDADGTAWPADRIELRLRFAKAIRISIDGNAHFCRGLLRTRYPESAADQRARAQDATPHERVEAS